MPCIQEFLLWQELANSCMCEGAWRGAEGVSMPVQRYVHTCSACMSVCANLCVHVEARAGCWASRFVTLSLLSFQRGPVLIWGSLFQVDWQARSWIYLYLPPQYWGHRQFTNMPSPLHG